MEERETKETKGTRRSCFEWVLIVALVGWGVAWVYLGVAFALEETQRGDGTAWTYTIMGLIVGPLPAWVVWRFWTWTKARRTRRTGSG